LKFIPDKSLPNFGSKSVDPLNTKPGVLAWKGTSHKDEFAIQRSYTLNKQASFKGNTERYVPQETLNK